MSEIAIRELKDHLSDYVRRVEAGEEFTITVSGRPVARLGSLSRKRRRIPSEEVKQMFEGKLADHALLAELKELLPDTIDDLDY